MKSDKSAPNLLVMDHKARLVISLAFVALTFSLYEPLMSWVILINVCAIVVRLSLHFRWYSHPPTTRTINLLSILAVAALIWLGFQHGLLLSMINLLVTACSLKLMIMRTQKDYLQLFLSLIFLSGTGYIFNQSIGFVGIYTLIIIVLFISLSLQYASNKSILRQAKQLGKLSLQALPIATLLFLVFPQLPPLWLMPSTKSATTGLSDTIRPGDIANLSQSSKLAFRAKFTEQVPQPSQRYWRALVLEHFDGNQWSQSDARRNLRQQISLIDKEFLLDTSNAAHALNKNPTQPVKFEYRVFAEASRQSWLFTLDAPIPADSTTNNKVQQTYTYSFLAEQPLMSAIAYDVKSYPSVLLNQTNRQFDTQINRQLPSKGNEQTRLWVNTLRQQYVTDEALTNGIMNYFAQQPFEYTLNPPLMQLDGIDAFLFSVQRGFCAHYASAMTFALRVAGIPARLVAGYQGGEMLGDNVMSIYQYDAHAWVEVWFDDKGWVRFDPTGVVAPNRLLLGLEQSLNNDDEFLANEALSLRKFKHIAFLAKLRQTLSRVDYFWSQWVLGFDKKQQQDLFKHILGNVTLQKTMYLMLGVVATIFALLAIFYLPLMRKQSVSPILHNYLKVVKWVEKKTQILRGTQSPQDYLTAVSPQLNEHAIAELRAITHVFIHSCYADTANTTSKKSQKKPLRKIKQHFKQLKRTKK